MDELNKLRTSEAIYRHRHAADVQTMRRQAAEISALTRQRDGLQQQLREADAMVVELEKQIAAMGGEV